MTFPVLIVVFFAIMFGACRLGNRDRELHNKGAHFVIGDLLLIGGVILVLLVVLSSGTLHLWVH